MDDKLTIDFPCITEEAKIGEVQVKVQPLHDWQDLHQTVVGVPERVDARLIVLLEVHNGKNIICYGQVQSGAVYQSQGFVMLFNMSCEGPVWAVGSYISANQPWELPKI